MGLKGVVWGFFKKALALPRVYAGVGGLALHGKAAGVPPPYPPPPPLPPLAFWRGKEGKREVFTSRNLSNTPPGSADLSNPKP